MAKIWSTIQISSFPIRHSSGQLFRYILLLPGLGPSMLFRYPLFLLGKKKKNQDCCSDILCSNLTLIGPAVQISSISTRPKTEPTIQISSISTWQKLEQLFRYLFLLLDSHWDSYLDIIRFHLAEVHACYSDLLCFYR